MLKNFFSIGRVMVLLNKLFGFKNLKEKQHPVKANENNEKLNRADRLLLQAMKERQEAKMTRSERLKAIAFKNVQERKKSNSNTTAPKMTMHERARLQAFKNVQERKKELSSDKKSTPKLKNSSKISLN